MEESVLEYIDAKLLTPDEFARQGGLWLVRFGQNIAKPDYVSGPRALAHYSIHFIREGKAELLHGTSRQVLSGGDAFCMYPGTIYRIRHVRSEKPLSMFWIAFDGPQSRALLHRVGFAEHAPWLRQIVTNELEHALRSLFMIETEGVKGYLRLQSVVHSIFSRLVTSEEAAGVREGVPHWIPGSIEFMKAHYAEGIHVQDVADSLALHRAYFSKAFTRHVGITPVKYLEKLRMEKSIELLRSTSYSIHEIALTLGYSDPYTFTHAFNRYFGMPPGKWRKTGGAN